MKDLWGNEIDEEDVTKTISPYQAFKFHNRYQKSFSENTCGNCKHSQRWEHHNKYYWKCELLGVSNSEATDIRKGYVCDKHIRDDRESSPLIINGVDMTYINKGNHSEEEK